MNIEEAKKLIDKQSIGKGGVGDIRYIFVQLLYHTRSFHDVFSRN